MVLDRLIYCFSIYGVSSASSTGGLIIYFCESIIISMEMVNVSEKLYLILWSEEIIFFEYNVVSFFTILWRIFLSKQKAIFYLINEHLC